MNSRTSFHLARQAVYDLDLRAVGYEYFYRYPAEDSLPDGTGRIGRASSAERTAASLAVLDRLVSDDEACSDDEFAQFINCTREAFLALESPDSYHKSLVFELDGTIWDDPIVVHRIAELSAGGVRICLDDYRGTPTQNRVLPFVRYVKIDYEDLVEQQEDIILEARRCGSRVIIKRVPDHSDLRLVRALSPWGWQGNALSVTELVPAAS